MKSLSPRLDTIRSFVPYGHKIADIGTDHALLPIYLLQNDRSPLAIATDLHKGPYQAAREAVNRACLQDKIRVLLGNGLEPLVKNAIEVDTIIIAGMGGRNIVEILFSHKEEEYHHALQSVQRLILQPMEDAGYLRQWLWQKLWDIVDEDLIEEGARIYEIIVAEKGNNYATGKLQHIPPVCYQNPEIGPVLLQKKHPLLGTYIDNKIEGLANILAELERAKPQEKQNCLEIDYKKRFFKNKIESFRKVITCLSLPKQ